MANLHPKKKPIVRNVLSLKEQLKLGELVWNHYTPMKLDNEAFARFVNKEHGELFRKGVTRFHIGTLLEALNIAPNVTHVRHDRSKHSVQGLTARVAALEDQVAKIAATLKGLRT
jgi:hypothetical protein